MRDITALHTGWLAGAAVLALVIPLSLAPAAHAAVDCAKSPTYLRKIPGGQELVFHAECEPPAVTPKPGKKGPTMAPVPTASAEGPVAIAGAGNTAAQAPGASTTKTAEPAPRRQSGPQSANRVRVQGYTRVRRQF